MINHNISKCNCGWFFVSRYKDGKICPQCRDNLNGSYIQYKIPKCVCCGRVLDKCDKKYCLECRPIVKRAYNRIYHQCRPDIEITSQINADNNTDYEKYCDGNCKECLYDDCILPVCEDDEQGELF